MHVITNTRQGAAARRVAFTLVEVMVAMAVVGIMVVALYGGLAWCVGSVRIARENLRATQIMAEKMEVIRLLTWEQITEENVLPTTFTTAYVSGEAGNHATNSTGGLTYYGKITLLPPLETQLLGTYTNDMRVINVKVYWTNQGLPHFRQINSYISRYGMQNYSSN
jgi:prepilin-type N-terminal cleavage/methylation domain-containing protein